VTKDATGEAEVIRRRKDISTLLRWRVLEAVEAVLAALRAADAPQ
jgi:hypothetical protein